MRGSSNQTGSRNNISNGTDGSMKGEKRSTGNKVEKKERKKSHKKMEKWLYRLKLF